MTRIEATALCEAIIANVERVIVGKREVVERTLVALLAGGHMLFEDVPGVGKTMLARAMARSVGGEFSRIQFTPDLLPSDITGVSIYNQRSGQFSFRPGPVFANILVADEVNRATPRTQAALLEAMEERQVTVDGATYPLPQPFMVIATENPIEYEGVYPLPESQLDRFLIRQSVGYPDREAEKQVIKGQLLHHPLHLLEAVASEDDIRQLQQLTAQVLVAEELYDYILDLVAATREHESLYVGASPRGTLALVRCSQALAIINGRDYVEPDDIKRLAVATLAHRMLLAPEMRMGDLTTGQVVQELLDRTPVPV